ncbi:MAG: PTS sugar transporter subunit IIC, partial [Intestinibacter sp.]|uniref:PTS sugar transporter subunit IIC n=1 Tax=Intestinibacter sp. TaxID=1965304 RepID=UPI0025BC4884
MGVIVSVLVGIALTLPISSAAICIMLSLSGLAGGAATVGCCCQMVGFAVMSFKENGVGGLFAQGLGTSMLQMPNIIKNWKIWIPPTLASAILGPLSTVVFKMENIPIGSGMGTCGLVGQFGTVTAMTEAGKGGMMMWVGILLLNFILPAVVTLIISEFMRSKNWIKPGDLKLDI